VTKSSSSFSLPFAWKMPLSLGSFFHFLDPLVQGRFCSAPSITPGMIPPNAPFEISPPRPLIPLQNGGPPLCFFLNSQRALPPSFAENPPPLFPTPIPLRRFPPSLSKTFRDNLFAWTQFSSSFARILPPPPFVFELQSSTLLRLAFLPARVFF